MSKSEDKTLSGKAAKEKEHPISSTGNIWPNRKTAKRQQISFSLCSKPNLSPWGAYVGVSVKTHAKMLLASAREAVSSTTNSPPSHCEGL